MDDEVLDDILAQRRITTLFQPIVDLDSAEVVAFEALSRGPAGPLESPDALFAAARRAGRLLELDELCRSVAIDTAIAVEIYAPRMLFVNVEPDALDTARLDHLLSLVERADGKLQVVLELTERAIAARPADLLATATRLRRAGWRIALDDVGADDMSLAFMPLVRPDIVKLDLRLVQQRPGPAVAEIMNAVNAYAERTGALLLAEGIETPPNVGVARALGARLGQGWLFGRPSATTSSPLPAGGLTLPQPQENLPAASPFECLPAGMPLRRSTKPLLHELSKHLEREAMRLGKTCMVVSAFQHERHFNTSTAVRYREIVDRVGFVAAVGEGLGPEPVRGLRVADLDPTDPVRAQWDVIVLSPHFAAALLARDLGDTGAQSTRRFEFALTYDRDVVTAAAHNLLSRVLPAEVDVKDYFEATPTARVAVEPPSVGVDAERSLRRALAAASNGVTIADMTAPDQPLIYVNAGFEKLSGVHAEEALGRNCRFLQGPDTDKKSVARLRAAMAAGREVRETLLNYRGADRQPWWNEVYLTPVFDDTGRLSQYIGVQTDVTARIEAERKLEAERRRSAEYLAEITTLARRDSLTGLLNRHSLRDRLDAAAQSAQAQGATLGVLHLDVNNFKDINDEHGYPAGDTVLCVLADRLTSCLRRQDLIARVGVDEFVVAHTGLGRDSAAQDIESVAARCVEAMSAPIEDVGRAGAVVTLSVSVGAALHGVDGESFDELMHVADERMDAAKSSERRLRTA